MWSSIVYELNLHFFLLVLSGFSCLLLAGKNLSSVPTDQINQNLNTFSLEPCEIDGEIFSKSEVAMIFIFLCYKT